MSEVAPRTYEHVKELARQTGMRIPDLLAMANQNDPYYIGPTQTKKAEWFAELWTRFDIPRGAHLRRIHYKLAIQAEPVLMVDGKPYENTDGCWQYLGAASKAARYLGLVDPDAFSDQRNPDAVLVREYLDDYDPTPSAYFDDLAEWTLPEVKVDLADAMDWFIPWPMVDGYDYADNDKPFHLELVSEKSTMDDVVVPLCQSLRVNYAPATGFQSITGVISLLHRVARSGKPGVVFYVSDFDPAGSFMPPSVARQIEFWRPKYAPDLHVLLLPIVLTPEQVRRYQLPPIPIKETDNRQHNFLAKYGVEGATELDALEALHPGELRRIIIKAAAPYRDVEIERRLCQAELEAEEVVSEAWREPREAYALQLKSLKEKTKAIVVRYQDRLESLRQAMNADLEPVREEMESLRQAIKADMAAFDPYLPDRPESELTLPDEFTGLFDSRRNYLEQMRFYKTATREVQQP